MLRKILEKGLQVFLSSVVAFAVDYAFAEAIEAGLLQMSRPLEVIMLVLLAGGSGYGMYKLLSHFDGWFGHNDL
jgi:hypothetical protein